MENSLNIRTSQSRACAKSSYELLEIPSDPSLEQQELAEHHATPSLRSQLLTDCSESQPRSLHTPSHMPDRLDTIVHLEPVQLSHLLPRRHAHPLSSAFRATDQGELSLQLHHDHTRELHHISTVLFLFHPLIRCPAVAPNRTLRQDISRMLN